MERRSKGTSEGSRYVKDAEAVRCGNTVNPCADGVQYFHVILHDHDQDLLRKVGDSCHVGLKDRELRFLHFVSDYHYQP